MENQKHHIPFPFYDNFSPPNINCYFTKSIANQGGGAVWFDGYFDKENGWEKSEDEGGGVILHLSSTKKHFGNYTIHVADCKGPIKRIEGINTGKNYTFSAWVYPKNNNRITLGVESDDISPNPSVDKDNLDKNDWQKIWCKIESSALTGASYIDIWIGNNGGDPSNFYVDDIRFYPEDALINTTYYDELLQQPIMSVDANDNPGRKIKYDGFGRPVKWYKMRHNKKDILIKEKEYHLMGDDL